MKWLTDSKIRKGTYICSTLLIVGFICIPISHTFTVKRAHALIGPTVVHDPISYIKTAMTSVYDGITAVSTEAETLKEITLDGIAWAAINLVIERMIQSTTDWVSSGFEGSPAFVTDLDGYMLDIGDEIVTEMIWGSESLNFLCSPFKLDVQLALDFAYGHTRRPNMYRAQCTFDGTMENLENFLDGDFYAGGGWDGWFDVAVRGNNPYQQFADAQIAIGASVKNAQGKELSLLSFANGFLNKKECDEYGCTVTTPGSVIEEQLNNVLDSSNRRLAVADEINELVGSLLTQLTQEVFSGASGLLGLNTARTDHTTGTRYDNYYSQQASARESYGYNETSATTFDSSLSATTKYRDLQQNIFSMLSNTERICSENNVSLSNSLQNKLTVAEDAYASANATVSTLNTLKYDLSLLESKNTASAVLTGLLTKYDSSSLPEAKTNLMSQFSSLINSDRVKNPSENVSLEHVFIPELQTELASYVDSSCRYNTFDWDTYCQSSPDTCQIYQY